MPPVWKRLPTSTNRVDFTGFANFGLSIYTALRSMMAEILHRLLSYHGVGDMERSDVSIQSYADQSNQRSILCELLKTSWDMGTLGYSCLTNDVTQLVGTGRLFCDLDLCENIQLCTRLEVVTSASDAGS